MAELVGRKVLAPARLWPDMAPPKGTSGWEGQITGVKSKSPELFFVKFPGDPSKYYFEGKDVRSWLLPDKGKGKQAAAEGAESSKASAKKRAAAAESPAKGSPQKKKLLAEPAGLKPLPPKPSSKLTKEALAVEVDAMLKEMSLEQIAQLVEAGKKILSQ